MMIVPIVSVKQAGEMYHCRAYDQNVKDGMTREPHVETARPLGFGYSRYKKVDSDTKQKSF